jgi:hypothetical protein
LVEKNTAILLAPRTTKIESMILSHSRRFQALLGKSRRSIKAGKSVPHDEFWKAVARRRKTKTAS